MGRTGMKAMIETLSVDSTIEQAMNLFQRTNRIDHGVESAS